MINNTLLDANHRTRMELEQLRSWLQNCTRIYYEDFKYKIFGKATMNSQEL